MKTNKRQTQYLTVPNTMLNDQDIKMKCDISSSLTSSISYQISSQYSNESSQSPQNTEHSMTDCDDKQSPSLYDQRATMINNGFTPIHEVAKTLQGCIWRVYYKESECSAIIKITNKILSQQHIGIDHRQGLYFECNENIKQEINMLYTLNTVNQNESAIHPAMIGLYKVFEDKFNIFIAMEDGGSDLLSLINKCHQQLKKRKMLLSDWQITAKHMMKQMTEFLCWLHYDKHVCHLDISLENLSIQNVEWEYDVKSKTFKLLPNFQIKFVDFGVAELFTEKIENKQTDDDEFDENESTSCDMEYEEEEDDEEYSEDDEDDISFECNKFVGKLKYFAPNIFNHMTFDARAADIWSLGIVLFMICTGYSPWNKPSDNDIYYNLIVIQQRLRAVLKHWNRECYIDDDVHQLFYRIFSDQMYRADAKEILQHSWLKM